MRRLTMLLVVTTLSGPLVQAQEAARSPGPPAQATRKTTDRARNRAAIAARDRAIAKTQQEAQARAEAEYRAMLPFLMEQQRQELQRLGDIERNVALHRMAAAAEAEARIAKQRADQQAWYLYYNRPR